MTKTNATRAAGSSAPACSPLPWTVEYDEAVKIKDARGDTVAILTHLHLRGRRSHDEVRANVARILSSPNNGVTGVTTAGRTVP